MKHFLESPDIGSKENIYIVGHIFNSFCLNWENIKFHWNWRPIKWYYLRSCHDVGYLKDPIMRNCDFSANMYHMNMVFHFLESLLLGLSLECFLTIFGHFFEILRHFEFDVYFWDADSFSVSQKLKNDENHLKYHPIKHFPLLAEWIFKLF